MIALKFERLLIAAELGAALIGSRAPPGLLGPALVPVPPAPLREAMRGFDPARVLAEALAATGGFALSAPLARRDRGRQRGGGRTRRLGRPPTIEVRREVPEEVVIVDDVSTTGATIAACASALRGAGAQRIGAVALAAVPERGAGLTRPRERA